LATEEIIPEAEGCTSKLKSYGKILLKIINCINIMNVLWELDFVFTLSNDNMPSYERTAMQIGQ